MDAADVTLVKRSMCVQRRGRGLNVVDSRGLCVESLIQECISDDTVEVADIEEDTLALWANKECSGSMQRSLRRQTETGAVWATGVRRRNDDEKRVRKQG